jgi:hypothetical protein
VLRMEWQSTLVLLRRRADHTELQEGHFFFVGWICSDTVSPDALLRVSARFCLRDLPDFFDMLCRGDLSFTGESLYEEA